MTVPLDTWVKLDIICGVGPQSTGTYNLTVTVPGQSPRTFENLPFANREFKKLEWYGFISLGEKAATFFIDDINLEPKLP